jgi:hypothetical protein
MTRNQPCGEDGAGTKDRTARVWTAEAGLCTAWSRIPNRHGQHHTGQPLGGRRSILPGAVNLLGRCDSDADRCSRQAGFLGSRGQGWPGTEPGRAAEPMVVPGPRRQDIPAKAGRRTYRRGRAGRRDRVRSARSQPAGRGHRCGGVPPGQSLARVAVPADVDSPVVGSDRGSSPGSRRGRAPQEAAPGRRPGGRDTAEGLAGGRGQDARAT